MDLHPNVTIEETSIEFEQDYYQALQTHLAGGAGLSDIQGIEVARIAEVTQTQADKWVDLNELGAGELEDTFFPWKWQAATTADGATLGLGTDTGPQAICYRTGPLRAGGAPDRPRGARGDVGDLGRLPRDGRAVRAERSRGIGLHRQPDRALQLHHRPVRDAVLRRGRQSDLRVEPGRQGRLGHRGAGDRGRPDRKARAVRPGVEPGLRERRVRDHCLSRVDDRLHQGPGRRRRRRQVGRGQHPRRRRQLGRLVPLHPGRERAPGGGVRADQVAHRPRAAGQDVDAGAALPVELVRFVRSPLSRRPPTTTSRAPRSARSSRSRRTTCRSRSSARRTAS